MVIFGGNIRELRSIHDDKWIDARIQQISRHLASIDHEFDSTSDDHLRKQYHLLVKQNEMLDELSDLIATRKIRIQEEYKGILKKLDTKHEHSKKRFSEYQKDLNRQVKEALKSKNLDSSHIAHIKHQHRECVKKMDEYHENIRSLRKDVLSFKDRLKDGCRKHMRHAKLIYYHS